MFAVVRLFDRYLSTETAKTDIENGYMNFIMTACVDLMGKAIDIDDTQCDMGKTTMRAYYHYAYHGQPDANTEQLKSFSQNFRLMENKILTALSSELLSPTPIEYLSLCCRWFSSEDAGAEPPIVGREIELKNADTFVFICDTLSHCYGVTEFTCKEIASIVSFYLTEKERTESRQAPIIIGSESITPELRELWASTPWSVGKEMIKKLDIIVPMIFSISEGMRRKHPERFRHSTAN